MSYPPLFNAYQLKLFADYDDLEHQYNYWCTTPNYSKAPGDVFANYQIDTSFVGGAAADSVVDAWITVFKALFAATTTFTRAELWRFAAGSQDGEFLSAYDISVAGTNGGSTVPASQGIMSFRTINGRVLKIYANEGVFNPGASAPVVVGGAGSINAVGTFVTGSDAFQCDREGGLAIAALRWFPGQSEALFKKRYRPS